MYDESDREFMARGWAWLPGDERGGAESARWLRHSPRRARAGGGLDPAPGSNHAEIEALLDARRHGHDARGATVYVSLEPCSHFGRTPPCATALIEGTWDA
jgi:tRNA(Arg) A34 adenosine deaminase TadA